MHVRRLSFAVLLLAVPSACSSDSGSSGESGSGGAAGFGGANAGGSAPASNGGTITGTGARPTMGGAVGIGSGGLTATGGVTASNGGASNGGASNGGASNGGASNSGGSTNGGSANGGASNSGGKAGASSGGASSSGGTGNGGASSGGASSSGGTGNGGASSGGASNSGGKANGGASSGGASNSGGTGNGGASSGGASNSGGAGGASSACPEGVAVMCGIVAAHNAVRAAAPSASPALPVMVWDGALAAHAQAWADTCPTGHNPDRNVGGQTAGENIFWSGSNNAVASHTPVDLWASEGQMYDITTNDCGTAEHSVTNFGCGHYTQLVWRSTIKVGCGMRTGCSGGTAQPWVCDYLPAGNFYDSTTGFINRPY